MLNTFSIDPYGDLEIRNVMLDVDGTNLEEAIEISFDDEDLETITIFGHINLDNIKSDDVELLIEENQ
jgi:hypothetical protein